MYRIGFSAITLAVSMFASTAHSQELTKDQLTKLFADSVHAGVNSEGTAFVTATRIDGTATNWWGFPTGPLMNAGTWRIDGNQYCRVWEGVPAKRCNTVRKTGPHSYEMWGKNGFGDDQMRNRFHLLKSE